MTGSAARIISALWLAALAVGLALQIWFPRIETDPVNDTYSVEVGGRNALYQFASRRLPSVARNHDPLLLSVPYLGYDETLCLLGPARYPSPREWNALLEWVQHGGNLLIAARWEDPGMSIPGLNAGVTAVESWKEKLVKSLKKSAPPAAGTTEPKGPAISGAVETSFAPAQIEWKSNGIIAAPHGEILLKVGEHPQVVRLSHGAGRIVLAASDYVFSNASLADRKTQNATLAVRLLQAAGTEETVRFDESLNATGTPRVVGILLDPLLRYVSIQFCVLALLFTWRGNRRFGAFLPKLQPARHDITDHANALGNLYYKVRDSNGVLRSYLDQLRTELKLKPTVKGSRAAIAVLARRINQPAAAIEELLSRATALADDTSLSRRDSARVIRELAGLRRAAAR